jgi:site-specific recombinase XerD
LVIDQNAVDDLGTLLSEWRTHLRARNRSKATIDSYVRCATAFRAYLAEHGMPTTAGSITREHVEAFLAGLADRVAPATTAKHYRIAAALSVARRRRRDSAIADGADEAAERSRPAGADPDR